MFSTLLTGCSSWKTLRILPAQYLTEKPGAPLRITQRSSVREILLDPHIKGDSLLGLAQRAGKPQAMAVPLDSIAKSEGRHFSPIKTAILVTGLGLPVFVVLLYIDFAIRISEH